MIYDTKAVLRSQLLNYPETGMGYQIIEGVPEGKYFSQRYVVYNSELIVEEDNQFDSYKKKIINEGFSKIRNASPYLELKSFNFISRNMIHEFKSLSESKKNETGRNSGTSGALDNPNKYANGTEVFVRLSAYEDDKRIDFEKKCLKAGSFATTEADYVICKYMNDDPIDRYALPNDEKISWAFYIQPNAFDMLQRGIVQPAFDHVGGGVEAYFEDGTSKNTYLKNTNY